MVLKTVQVSVKRKKYKEFLYGAYCKAGPCKVLVCAMGLGQVRIVDMKKDDRDSLLRQIEFNKDHFEHLTLQLLAKSYQIPISLDGTFLFSLLMPTNLEQIYQKAYKMYNYHKMYNHKMYNRHKVLSKGLENANEEQNSQVAYRC